MRVVVGGVARGAGKTSVCPKLSASLGKRKEPGWANIYQVFDSKNQPRKTQGISWRNVLANRVHVYFGHRFGVAERIVQWVQPG